MGKYQGRIAADHILGKEVAATCDKLGRRGRPPPSHRWRRSGAPSQAEEDGLDVRAVDVETAANAGASFVGRNAPGTSRIVVDEDHRVIVGATFVGPEIAESLHAATIAVTAAVPLERLRMRYPRSPRAASLAEAAGGVRALIAGGG